MDADDLRALARRWMDADPDPTTVAELRAILEGDRAKCDAELADRFGASLEFGTAGLRGVIGAGPNRMNRAVVLRTTHGLATYLLSVMPDAKTRGVVVGFDGRTLSRELAEDTACVLAAHGIPAHLFAQLGPTPLTAFAVLHLGAAAGVMVTASHNPPEYNGYKVYWANGAQIVTPIDAGIAKGIEDAPPARDVPRADRSSPLVKTIPDTVTRAYLDAIRGLAVHPTEGDRSIRIVYTPMHGVGDALARTVLREAGFAHVSSVPEQQQPDRRFPTVAFPNPEEKGAMDLAFALGTLQDADLVIANDPDADRLALAVPSRTGWRQLSGNEIGVLLGHYLLTEKPAGAKPRLVVSTVVSSPQLGSIALALGVRYEETLTGFKWITNRAMDLADHDFVFGYEEALGYTVGEVVRDKDGISAALLAAEIGAIMKARGTTILGYLEQIARTYGLWVSRQVSVTKKGVDGAAEIRAMMDGFRASPPDRIGPLPVLAIVDVAAGTRTEHATGEKTRIALPPSNVLVFELAGRSRVVARPSGTEPKIKFYFDVREPVQEGEAFTAAEARATATLDALAKAFLDK